MFYRSKSTRESASDAGGALECTASLALVHIIPSRNGDAQPWQAHCGTYSRVRGETGQFAGITTLWSQNVAAAGSSLEQSGSVTRKGPHEHCQIRKTTTSTIVIPACPGCETFGPGLDGSHRQAVHMAGLTVFQSHRPLWVPGTYDRVFDRYAPARAARPMAESSHTHERSFSVSYHDPIVTWLKDAYTMENSIVEILEKQVDATAGLPEMQDGIRHHLEESRRHVTLVESCLDQLGENPSAIKTGMASLGGKLQGVMGAPKDSLVKFVLDDYAAEHLEIASYKALIVAAKDAGLIAIADACEGILLEEVAMAAWLDGQVQTAVREMLSEAHN